MAPPGWHYVPACCAAIVVAVRDVARRVAVTCMWLCLGHKGLQARSHTVAASATYGLQASQ